MKVLTGFKSTIEALSVPEGFVAYATDTNELGAYDGASWAWNDLTGVDTFLELTDTPASYTGRGGQLLMVADNELLVESIEIGAIDVDQLAGANGNSGEIPESDGTNVSWVEPDARYSPKDHDHTGDAGDGGQLDHGALSGLTDDDHSHYVLITGARDGATGAAQGMVSGIETDTVAEYSLNNGVTIDGLRVFNGYLYDGGGLPGVKVYASSSQAVSNDTGTVISMDSEYWDTHGFHEGVTNPSRLTVPAGLDGRYLIYGYAFSDAQFTPDVMSLQIYLDGSTVSFQNRDQGGVSGRYGLTVVGVLQLAAAQYVELRIYHFVSGGSSQDFAVSVGMYRIGD